MRARYLSAVVLLASAACTSMQVVQPAQVIPNQQLKDVWVKEPTGEVVDVLRPRIDGDTLKGTIAEVGEPYAIALKDIVFVKARQHDKTKTTIAWVSGIALSGLGLYALVETTGSHVSNPCQGALAIESECQNPSYTNGQ